MPYNQTMHHAAIGNVAIVWSSVENNMQQILWRLAGLNATNGRSITQHMPFRSTWDAIRTLANENSAHKHLSFDLKTLYSECDDLRIKRNDIVHAIWGIFLSKTSTPMPLTDLPHRLVIKARGHLDFQLGSMSIQEIKQIADDIMAFDLKMMTFADKNIPPLVS